MVIVQNTTNVLRESAAIPNAIYAWSLKDAIQTAPEVIGASLESVSVSQGCRHVVESAPTVSLLLLLLLVKNLDTWLPTSTINVAATHHPHFVVVVLLIPLLTCCSPNG